MAQKQNLIDQWITSKKAAEILTERSGHTVSQTYIRRLGATGKIERKEIDARTVLYLKSDVEGYQVKKRGDGSIRVAAGHPRRTEKEKGTTVTTK